jgi:tetratricopeptide (TPR) repeat protein
METPMRVCCGALRKSSIVAGCLLLAVQLSLAQKKPAVSTAESTRGVLIEKARDLESRGRPDMSAQLWQQILLSDPNNTEALAGLARDYKLMGSADKANDALDRLRKANPNDPNIGRIEALSSTQGQNEQLKQAGELAQQGKVDDAMRIYRQLYGDHPPDGDIGMAYYQTLYGTATGKAEAIAGMRAMADRNPGDPRYAIELGTMLTYDGRTRAEGIHILQAHSSDPDAQAALRQALIWNAANPSSTGALRQYLKQHPQDTEVAQDLKSDEAKQAQMNFGIARTPAEREAFAALNAHRLDEAQARFTALLQKEPNNGRVAAGMGFLRMQQKNFGGAISYLTQAKQNGYKAKTVDDALATSRFWYTMSEASQAFQENQLNLAATKYRAALAMNPKSPEALNGLAGLLTKAQHYPASAQVYEQLVSIEPGNADGWRGLFLAYARDNQYQKALATSTHFPAQVNATLLKDPEYLRTLATIDQAQGRTADAQRVLAEALALPFPNNGTSLKADTKLQYAGILMDTRHYDQAVVLYMQILSDDPGNVSAWMGLVSAHHEQGQDALAIADVKRMPAATYESALADPGFLSMLGAIYQQANQFEIAQGMLESAEKREIAAGGQPSVALQLQLASIYLLRNHTEEAYAIYRQVLARNPDRADAWKGLISTLLATNRNAEALQEISLIPAPARKQLENDIEFEQSEASAYAANGDIRHAIEYTDRVEAHYAKLKIPPPPGIEVQNAWLLYNTGNDRALYPTLMRLGGRSDLTVTQRETVQEIWANWSVRRAGAAMDNGDARRAVEILDAAYLAFPNNMTVRKAVAGGYARVGRAKESVALFKTLPMENSTSGDFQGAIGAALSANDRTQAELWLRMAMERYPHDPAVLGLAARYEQSRGDNQRAADYWRASLAAMRPASPTDRLAHELDYPEQDTRPHRAVTAEDLHRLLNPDDEPFAKTTVLPSMPAYGADPYQGSAPVIPAQQQSTPQTPATDASPAVKSIPTAQSPSPQLFHQQSAAYGGLVVRDAVYHAADQNNIQPAYGGLGRLSYGLPSAELQQASLEQAQASVGPYDEDVPISANPPHSMASDAWKGLIFSLMAGNRNAEALAEFRKVPVDIRRQLEGDVEFVQGMASLYFAVGDTARATDYLNRVENFYVVHRSAVPASLELQHAWLLYNMRDASGLYPVLTRLDARQDLTAAQREQVNTLWANWAVRSADAAMASGNVRRGVEILRAAFVDYPDNVDVRRAVAGAYIQIGRPSDALALYKTFAMDSASPGDYAGAISAAMAASDMGQADTWLRQALSRYPRDPQVLGVAARYEQTRGNNERAITYWRAALAAMPPGTAVKSFDSGQAYPAGNYGAPAPGDTKRLLDPGNGAQTGNNLPPLPSYGPVSSSQVPVGVYGTPSNAPIYIPQDVRQGTSHAEPVLIEQSWMQEATPEQPAVAAQDGQQGRVASGTAGSSSGQSYTGVVNLPPSERTVDSSEPEASPAQKWTPGLESPGSVPAPGLRITSQPMGTMAAQVQALFAEQTDSQLTQGSASVLHAVPNAAVPSQFSSVAGSSSAGQFTVAQYTPSAQDAATGAYSAPKPQAAAPENPAPATPATPTKRHKRIKKAAQAASEQTSPQTGQPAGSTLGNSPTVNNNPAAPVTPPMDGQQQVEGSGEDQEQTNAPAASGAGLTDEQLEQRDLPPLRGPWVRVQRQAPPLSPRDEAEMQLHSIESGYSGWLGGTGLVNYRSGALGYDHLSAFEAPFEATMPLGYGARFAIVAKPVILDSGQADGSSTIAVVESTTGGSVFTTIPQPIGTLTATSTTVPAQQNASGVGGELQLIFPHLAIAGGYTPAGFLVATFTARATWRPGNGPFTFNFARDSQTDSQLSYAGLRDPAGNTLGTQGQIWGGVVYNQGNVQFSRGDAESGYYFGAGGQYLTGYNVEHNNRIDGDGGAYWRVMTAPEYGTLSVGANFFGMHYSNNQDAFTHGMGGYFSPQGYFLANVPFTFVGHYLTNWHYNIMGGLGVQAFNVNKTPLWPLAVDKALETSQNNPMLPDMTSVGPNYDIRSQMAYQVSPHWFAGGFFGANNTRNYSQVTVGFYVRYLFRSQPSTVAGPTGLFPYQGLRPFTVP